mmetsp:Transcript_5144/g.10489  ORF Transcript_5144/g.10489 Transcript_5144/m.10489 type:complete len:272 (-) Transcript_5144:8-823(-)
MSGAQPRVVPGHHADAVHLAGQRRVGGPGEGHARFAASGGDLRVEPLVHLVDLVDGLAHRLVTITWNALCGLCSHAGRHSRVVDHEDLHAVLGVRVLSDKSELHGLVNGNIGGLVRPRPACHGRSVVVEQAPVLTEWRCGLGRVGDKDRRGLQLDAPAVQGARHVAVAVVAARGRDRVGVGVALADPTLEAEPRVVVRLPADHLVHVEQLLAAVVVVGRGVVVLVTVEARGVVRVRQARDNAVTPRNVERVHYPHLGLRLIRDVILVLGDH